LTGMRYRRLGASGLSVSVVGLGTNNFGTRIDLAASIAVVHAAIDCGVTLFDTADAYGPSEEFLGRALAGRRDDAIVATKVGAPTRPRGIDNGEDWGARGGRRYLLRAVESSLRRLDTEWIDLLQLHEPDPLTPLEETCSGLDQLVQSGKVRYLGHSKFAAWQAVDAHWTARAGGFTPFISAQNEYNLLNTGAEVELIPALDRLGVGLLPYLPLAGGLLTGKYRRDAPVPQDSRIAARSAQATLTDAMFARLARLEDYAQQRGRTLLEVAIGGLAARPTVASVISGATSAEQVVANVDAGCWQPSEADAAELAELTGEWRARA
jgi:aryl-alcohol dehydrogenase-like predicted oxidoreductase